MAWISGKPYKANPWIIAHTSLDHRVRRSRAPAPRRRTRSFSPAIASTLRFAAHRLAQHVRLAPP